jgi:hypothetical protein
MAGSNIRSELPTLPRPIYSDDESTDSITTDSGSRDPYTENMMPLALEMICDHLSVTLSSLELAHTFILERELLSFLNQSDIHSLSTLFCRYLGCTARDAQDRVKEDHERSYGFMHRFLVELGKMGKSNPNCLVFNLSSTSYNWEEIEFIMILLFDLPSLVNHAQSSSRAGLASTPASSWSLIPSRIRHSSEARVCEQVSCSRND